jgi:hypothetical protein
MRIWFSHDEQGMGHAGATGKRRKTGTIAVIPGPPVYRPAE